MKVKDIQFVLLVTITADNDEDLTDERAKEQADAMLEETGGMNGWAYNGVERRNYDEVVVVYVAVEDDDA